MNVTILEQLKHLNLVDFYLDSIKKGHYPAYEAVERYVKRKEAMNEIPCMLHLTSERVTTVERSGTG